MTTDARQRAREAAYVELRRDNGKLGNLLTSNEDRIVAAIEAYFNERMRGEASAPERPERPEQRGPVTPGDPVMVHITWSDGAWWPGVIRVTRDSVDGPIVAGETFGPLGQISTWSSLLSAEGTAWRRREDTPLVVEVLRERLTASQRYVAELEAALATMRDNRDMARVEADVSRARIAELEAVVRAADAMRDAYNADTVLTYNIARAKVEVPGG